MINAQFLNAQDLVINGSFETFKKCPEGPALKSFKLDGKVKSAQGVPDHYSECSGTFGVPQNWSGEQSAYAGSAYTGLTLTTDKRDECERREYIQVPLSGPLENGRRYRLTFHVSPSENSGYVTDRIGAIFSKVDHSKNGLPPGSRQTADVDNALGHLIQDTTTWTTVSGIYNAKGGERFIVIGNFQECNRSTRKKMYDDKIRSIQSKTSARSDPNEQRGNWTEWMSHTAYVFLDAVTLMPDTSSPENITGLSAELACPEMNVLPIGPELIGDPSFDQNETPSATGWKNASDGTPDLFNGVTGIYLYSNANRDDREYIRTPLADMLSPCITYHVSMDVQRNTSYAYAVDAIGIALVDTFKTPRNRDRMDFPWAWRSPVGSVIANTDGQITLCGNFRPATCATQLLLGNFSPDTATTIVQVGLPNDGPFAYYFIDNVNLFAVDKDSTCVDPCIGRRTNEVVDPKDAAPWPDQITLHFNSNSDQPLELEPGALKVLAEIMLENPNYKLLITGHADNSGLDDSNDRIALNRADRLASLLKASGVPQDQIVTVSAGAREPVADNSTAEGRAMNRRVVLVMEQ